MASYVIQIDKRMSILLASGITCFCFLITIQSRLHLVLIVARKTRLVFVVPYMRVTVTEVDSEQSLLIDSSKEVKTILQIRMRLGNIV